MDWSAVGAIVGPMAPMIGQLLGGFIPFPGGAVLGGMAGKVVAEALGVPNTPEAVHEAVTTGDPAEVAAKLGEAETKVNAQVEMLKAALADVQDARSTEVKLVQAGSLIAWAPIIVSAIIILGFIILSFLAMKPETAGVDKSVTLYLLGAWQSLATMAASYWLGSSAGSSEKTTQLAALAGVHSTAPPPKASTAAAAARPIAPARL